MLASGAFSIDGTGASDINATTGGLTISTITSGDLALTSVAAVNATGVTTSSFKTTGASADINITTEGTTADITIDATTTQTGDVYINGDNVYITGYSGSGAVDIVAAAASKFEVT